MNTTNTQIDFKKVEAFAGQVIGDVSATMASAMTQIGYKLGLFRAMHGAGRLSSNDLATRTNTHARYVQEWLNCQAAGGYVTYDPATRTYELPYEHGLVLVDEDSPAFLAAGLDIPSTIWSEEEKLVEEFRNGHGLGWHMRTHKLFFGVESFYRTGYKAYLTQSWIPALNGIADKLQAGGTVADIGCGHGASSILIAQAFPESHVYGFDYHKDSINVARERARAAGIENISFHQAKADDYPGYGYDLICFMDAFHDLGRPKEAAAYALPKLSENGSVMLVEPFAGDKVEDNLNPIGRMFYAGSTALCVPHSQSEGGACLGAQAGEKQLHDVLKSAGYNRVRTATSTYVNLIVEAKR
jgi:2-polyprenyl-3-methyl-5-hydroxy-6-metoxy-1,4-benzoquinol methylase